MSKPMTQEERILIFYNKILERKVDGITWIETITEYCDDNGIEYEDIVKLIPPTLKTKIWEESVKNHTVFCEKKEAFEI